MSNNILSYGILVAMPEEFSVLENLIVNPSRVKIGLREIITGEINNKPVFLTLTGIGKVASTLGAAILCNHFNVSNLIVTGVAGGVGDNIHVGDFVVAKSLIQHDIDASPVPPFEKFEIPSLRKKYFETDVELSKKAIAGLDNYLKDKKHNVHSGIIASGDQFIASQEVVKSLSELIPGLSAIEMEGAAVAQVGYEMNVPVVVARCISDKGDEHAPGGFMEFIKEYAAPASAEIVRAVTG